MTDKADRFVVHPQAAYRAVGGEIFVVTADRAFHRLSVPTAVDIFQAIAAGRGRVPDLVALLVEGYRVTPEAAQQDISVFLQSLLDKQVIVRAEA